MTSLSRTEKHNVGEVGEEDSVELHEAEEPAVDSGAVVLVVGVSVASLEAALANDQDDHHHKEGFVNFQFYAYL